MNPNIRREKLESLFREQFGAKPEKWFRAPGRVDLMGSHTDYNDGFVLLCSINRDTWIAATSRDDDQAHVYSDNIGAGATFSVGPDAPLSDQKWALYVQAVALTLQAQGYPCRGFNAVIHGTVPLGSGLSSSASLEVATAVMLSHLTSLDISVLEIAKICQQAENKIVGVQCGILDQYSSVMGQRHAALLLDCRNLTSAKAAFPKDIGLVICNTCAPRELSGSEYGERRSHCEQGAALIRKRFPDVSALRDVTMEQFEQCQQDLSPVVAKRCRFIIEENARVHALAKALSENDKQQIGALAKASYHGACNLYGIGVPAMDAMMDAMRSGPGVIGARQAGAGFGGCMLAFVDKASEEAFIDHVSRHYKDNFGIEPEIYGARTSPGAGELAHC